MKKLLALLLVFIMLCLTFVGCNKSGDVTSDVSSEEVSSEEEVVSEEEVSSDEPIEEDTAEEDFDYEVPVEDDEEYEEEEEEPLTPEQIRMQTMLLGEDEKLNKAALYSEGQLGRLAKAMNKSKKGEQVTLVFYGNGANTGKAGEVAENETPYYTLVKEWWEANIGHCQVINAGTENLTSPTACLRVEHDVLRYEPDVVFLDFAVQDNINGRAKPNGVGYDNLIRRILDCKSNPAIVTLMLTGAEQESFTMNPINAGIFTTAAKEQKVLAERYSLPIIDFEQAFWDVSVEVVKVTTKKEVPLVNWDTIARNNVVMNDDGHKILAGTIKYFLNKVLNKLGTISTADFDYNTDEGYYGDNRYMDWSYTPISEMVEGKNGYSINLTANQLAENNYNYASENFKNPLTPNVKTWRHYDYIPGEHDENYAYKEENPEYFTVNLPKPVEKETHFMFYTTSSVSNKNLATSSPLNYAPISVDCYDAEGKLLGSVKPEASTYKETANSGKSSTAKLYENTTKITIKAYTSTGGTIYFNGIAVNNSTVNNNK